MVSRPNPFSPTGVSSFSFFDSNLTSRSPKFDIKKSSVHSLKAGKPFAAPLKTTGVPVLAYFCQNSSGAGISCNSSTCPSEGLCFPRFCPWPRGTFASRLIVDFCNMHSKNIRRPSILYFCTSVSMLPSKCKQDFTFYLCELLAFSLPTTVHNIHLK